MSNNSNKELKLGLYMAFEFNIDKNKDIYEESDGIIKKIRNQINTLEESNYRIDFWNPYSKRKHSIRRFARRCPFYYLNNWKFDYSKAHKYDFIYIRKPWFMDGDLIRFLKKFKKYSPKTKILLEIATYPYDEEGKHINMIPLSIKDKKWRKHLEKYVDRIVTYSNDEMIFNIKTIQVSNAIDVKGIKPIKHITNNLNEINLVACSSLYYWHGYDRAIEGIKNYYINKDSVKPDIKFHIIGEGEEQEKYTKMIKDYKLEKYIIMHGRLTGDDLDKVYNLCDIALDSMGRHRSGVFYNSSLKGKEYCAKGLPIVSGITTDIDNDKEYAYYERVSADDKAIDMNFIIDFYNKVYCTGKSREDIINEIVLYSERRFDYSVAMKPIINYITS